MTLCSVPSASGAVERDKSLVAHLPQGVALDEATRLIASKLLWVHQKLAEHGETARDDVFRIPEFVDGEGFHLLGKHYRLKLVDVPKNVNEVLQENNVNVKRGAIEAVVWSIPFSFGVLLRDYLDDPKIASQPHASTLMPLVGTLSSGVIYCSGR